MVGDRGKTDFVLCGLRRSFREWRRREKLTPPLGCTTMAVGLSLKVWKLDVSCLLSSSPSQCTVHTSMSLDHMSAGSNTNARYCTTTKNVVYRQILGRFDKKDEVCLVTGRTWYSVASI